MAINKYISIMEGKFLDRTKFVTIDPKWVSFFSLVVYPISYTKHFSVRNTKNAFYFTSALYHSLVRNVFGVFMLTAHVPFNYLPIPLGLFTCFELLNCDGDWLYCILFTEFKKLSHVVFRPKYFIIH